MNFNALDQNFKKCLCHEGETIVKNFSCSYYGIRTHIFSMAANWLTTIPQSKLLLNYLHSDNSVYEEKHCYEKTNVRQGFETLYKGP